MTLAPLRYVGQALALGLFFGAVGYLSTRPAYTHRLPGDAQLVVAFSHSGARITECRPLTPEEIAALAPNMRRTSDCPRARVPLRFWLEIDGATAVDADLPPSGIADDGRASQYARLTLPPGRHRVTARLRDSRREEGYDWQRTVDVDLAPRQSLSIDFAPETGGFVFR